MPKTEGALGSSFAGVLPEDEEAVEEVFSLLGLVGVAFVGTRHSKTREKHDVGEARNKGTALKRWSPP